MTNEGEGVDDGAGGTTFRSRLPRAPPLGPVARFLAWAIGHIVMIVTRLVLEVRYRLYGFQLPPWAPISTVLQWRATHGSFASHMFAPAVFRSVPRKPDGTEGDLAAIAIPLKGLVVFVKGVELTRAVLTDKKTFPTRGTAGFESWVPLGLLALPTGPMWQLHRRLVSRFLSTDHLRKYSNTIRAKTAELVTRWAAVADTGEPQDVQAHLSKATLDIISTVGFGVDSHTQSTVEQTKLSETADIILEETALRAVQSPIMPYVTPVRQKRFREAVAWARDLVSRTGTLDGSDEAGANMISMLRAVQRRGAPGETLSDEEILQEVLTINGAGHETTANTLSWALYLLALHPVEQRRLQEEVDEVVAGDCATFDEAQRLDRTLCAVYETLRLYPTVPNYPREAAEHCRLGGFDVPRGTVVVVAQMSVNRDARWFPEPHAFKPSRFAGAGLPRPSQPVGAPRAPDFAFTPFGAGSRTCVGQRLAVLEAVQILSGVLKRFRVDVPPGAPAVVEHTAITLRPKGMRLRFYARE